MPKIIAAGDEVDGWEARSAEEIQVQELWGAVEFAVRELKAFTMPAIFEEGREWTRIWHELGLSKLNDADGPISLTQQTAADLLKRAEESNQAKGLLMEVMAIILERGGTLAPSLRDALVSHLRGSDFSAEKNKDSDGSRFWARNYMINYVAGLVCTIYSTERTRGKMSEDTVAASDIIYHAFKEMEENPIGFGTVQNIIFNPDPSHKSVSNYNRENYLNIRSLIIKSSFDECTD